MEEFLQEYLVPSPHPTIVITAPVLDNEAVDALTATLYKLGYNQVVTENVTRITATRSPNDVISE